jgi:hypothetical protein
MFGEIQFMTPKQEHLVKAQIKGLRPAVLMSSRDHSNCHYTLGQSLNAIRDVVLSDLSEEDKEFIAAGMPQIDVEVPARGKGEYTVGSSEALRLLSQLAEVMGMEDTPNQE